MADSSVHQTFELRGVDKIGEFLSLFLSIHASIKPDDAVGPIIREQLLEQRDRFLAQVFAEKLRMIHGIEIGL